MRALCSFVVALAGLLAGACASVDHASDAAAAGGDANACRNEPWFEPVEVTCDEIDNDCDGSIDDVAAAPVWYADEDGDGFGDLGDSTAACTAPAGHVDNANDCDDARAFRNPDALERCDGVDNDCDGLITDETCTVGCTATLAPSDNHSYVFCNLDRTWPSAHDACVSFGLLLTRVDDAAENSWIRATGNTLFTSGQTIWIGANGPDPDPDDGNWYWDDGAQFWTGRRAVDGGHSENGLYNNWDINNEPNQDGNEDCALMATGLATWVDTGCNNGHRFVCERL